MGSHVRRALARHALVPVESRCRSRHIKLPGSRVERRRFRSRLRAARFQERIAADRATCSGSPTRVPRVAPAFELLALRPSVARVLDSCASERGITRAACCVAVLSDFARSATPPVPSGDDLSSSVFDPLEPLPSTVPTPLPAVLEALPSSSVVVPDADVVSDVHAAPARLAPPFPDPPMPALQPFSVRLRSTLLRHFVVGTAVFGVAAAAVALWFLVGALRYDLTGGEAGEAFVLDRLTGRVWTCSTDSLRVASPSCRSVSFHLPGESVAHTLGAFD